MVGAVDTSKSCVVLTVTRCKSVKMVCEKIGVSLKACWAAVSVENTHVKITEEGDTGSICEGARLNNT